MKRTISSMSAQINSIHKEPTSCPVANLFPDSMGLRLAGRKALTLISSPPCIIGRFRWASSSSKVNSDRLSSVIDTVNDSKLPPELRGQRNNVRSETDIINVVEQRVWHAMEEGQFENLPGKGKPLDLSCNPHADPAEDTLYRILNKNGCAPEWVELNKEIRNSIAEWRSALKRAWACKDEHHDSKWLESSEALKLQLRNINNKVFHYNLIVPFGRQMNGLKWEREIDKLSEQMQLDK